MNSFSFPKHEIEQLMSTGMTRKEAIEELSYWRQVSNMLKGDTHA